MTMDSKLIKMWNEYRYKWDLQGVASPSACSGGIAGRPSEQ